MCLKESCFPDRWKVSLVVPVLRNVGNSSTAENCRPVSLLFVVSKIFEKLVNNRLVDHLEKCGLWFWIFLINCRSSVVSDRITRACNSSGATRAVALVVSKAFGRAWHAGLFHKRKSYEISGQIFGLILSFFSNRRLQVVLDGKSSQKYPGTVGVPQGSILDDVVFDIAINANCTTLYSKCDQAFDMWQQLELAFELESELRDTVDWGRK